MNATHVHGHLSDHFGQINIDRQHVFITNDKLMQEENSIIQELHLLKIVAFVS